MLLAERVLLLPKVEIDGVWEQLLDTLTVLERRWQEREATPNLQAVDSLRTKKVAFLSLETGIDVGKCVSGRKRHIAVDTLGLPWAIVVTAANVSDTAAGCQQAARQSVQAGEDSRRPRLPHLLH